MTVNFHIGNNYQSLRHILYFTFGGNGSAQQHIKSGLQISIFAKISLINSMNLITKIYAFSSNQTRTRRKSYIVSCKRPLGVFSAIHAQRNSHIKRRTSHRSRSIYNGQAIERLVIKIISEIIPILIDHLAINIIADTQSLLDYLIRIEGFGINLSSLILGKSLILSLNHISSSESILIDKAGFRRDLIELNFIPAICGHKTLKYFNTLSQNRKSFAVLARGHTQILSCALSESAGFLTRSIFRLQPFSKQRRGLTLHIQFQLFANKMKSFIFQLGIEKDKQVIPTTIFRAVTHITQCCFGMLSSQPAHTHTEETPLALSTAGVPQIKQALQSKALILFKCLLKKKNNIRFRTRAISSANAKHIIQIILSRISLNGAIFGITDISSVNQTINKLIHLFHLQPFSRPLLYLSDLIFIAK